MQLLQDTFIIENLQVLTEGKGSDVMKIKGVFGRCNEKNNNGRIYPASVLQSQLDKVSPLIMERRLCGELDHPQNDTVKLSNASHLITHLEMKGTELIGEAELLKTPAGMTAQALINGGVKIGISSRGMGTLSEDQNGDKIVNEDFKLVTFDLVADPSTRGAYPGLSESTEGKFARETQSKLQKEDNFVTLLKSKMRDAYQPFIEEANGAKVAGAGESKQDPGNMSAEQMRVANQRTSRTAAAAGTHASVRRRRKGLLASTEGEFALIKADGHWHKMAYALHASLHEGVAAASDDLARDLLDDQPEDKTGVGMAAHERRRGLRKHHRSTLRTSLAYERGKTKEARNRIVQKAKGERSADRIKKGSQFLGVTTQKGEAERGAESKRRAAKITAGGRRLGTLGLIKHKGTGEIEAEGERKAANIRGRGKGEEQAAEKIAIAKGEGQVERSKKRQKLYSKIHGTAVDTATKAGQAFRDDLKGKGAARGGFVAHKEADRATDAMRDQEARKDARAKARDEGDPDRKEHETKKAIPRVGQIGLGSAEREKIKGQEALMHSRRRFSSAADDHATDDSNSPNEGPHQKPYKQSHGKAAEIEHMWKQREKGSPQAGEGAEASHASLEQGLQRRGTSQPSQTRGGIRGGSEAVGGRVTSTSTPAKGQETFTHSDGESGAANPAGNAALSQQRAADRTKIRGKALKSLKSFQTTSDKPATQKTISGSRGQEAWQRERGRERKRGEVSIVPGAPKVRGGTNRIPRRVVSHTEYHRFGSLLAEILQ